jgi:hypothetical protein
MDDEQQEKTYFDDMQDEAKRVKLARVIIEGVSAEKGENSANKMDKDEDTKQEARHGLDAFLAG